MQMITGDILANGIFGFSVGMVVYGLMANYIDNKEKIRLQKETIQLTEKYIAQCNMQGDDGKAVEYIEYQDGDGRRYRIMHDHWKFYRAFSFAPTTEDVAAWKPVPNLPWQLSFNAAQNDLNALSERKHWTKAATSRFMPEDIRDRTIIKNER